MNDVTSKICTWCGRILPAHSLYFHKKHDGVLGFYAHCKKCVLIKSKNYYQVNKQRILDRVKEYNRINAARVSERQKNYRGTRKKYREANKQKIKEGRASYYRANKEKTSEYTKEYLYKYCRRSDIKEKRNKVRRERFHSDSKFRVNSIVSEGIRGNLKYGKNGKSWLELVDFNVEELENRLRETIPEGYTWEDFLAGELHIDHIIPKSKFNYEKAIDPDFKRAWCLDNLQLLPARENLSKGAKLEKPLQMGLIFG